MGTEVASEIVFFNARERERERKREGGRNGMYHL
jgi:hypothetical protein